MNKFTLKLADGRWVSSPTNTVTENPNLAGVFTAADQESAAELRGAMEQLHGPLELVPWQGKESGSTCPACGLSGQPPDHLKCDDCGSNMQCDAYESKFGGRRGQLSAGHAGQHKFVPDDRLFGDVIYSYTRKDALADGVQIDVSEMAREAGLKFPVYLTRAVWENYVRVPDGVRGQDEKGRLWDIVWMLRMSARRTSGPQMTFKLHVRNDNRDRTPPLVTLKAVCGPRDIDDPAAAITVLMVDED